MRMPSTGPALSTRLALACPTVAAVAVVALAIAALAVVGFAVAGPAAPRFAVYRVDLVDADTAPAPGQDGRPSRPRRAPLTQERLLAQAVRRGPPILTEADIVTYCWAEQRIQLTPEGARRWQAQGGANVPLTGLPLLVVLDGEPCYGAMLWNPLSSGSSLLPQMTSFTFGGRVVIGGMLITAAGDTIRRENHDPRVRRLMEELGKLSPTCGS